MDFDELVNAFYGVVNANWAYTQSRAGMVNPDDHALRIEIRARENAKADLKRVLDAYIDDRAREVAKIYSGGTDY